LQSAFRLKLPPMPTPKEYMMRLKRASLPELLYRTKHRLENEWFKRKVRHGSPSLPIPRIQREDWAVLKMPDLEWDPDEQEIESLLNGRIETLNTDQRSIEAFEEKNRKRFFGEISLNAAIPDIRAVWEPGRLQHVTKLILAGRSSTVSDPSGIRKAVKSGILDWIGRNPYLMGPHYISPMECGLRVPVFVYGLITQNDWSEEDCGQVLRAIYEHGCWVSKRLSLYASLGNHTVCECLGLVFSGAVYRNTAQGKRWFERGFSLLDQELRHQVLDDGGPAEQSMGYHRFVLDLYWLATDFLEKNHLAACNDWTQRLKDGEAFLSHFTNRKGRSVSIGDSDDGWAVAPGVNPKRYEPESTSSKSVQTFEQSGYTVIEGNEGVRLTFDHGPLGMPPLYNHGHADALSITLQQQGKEILVDPGTFRYNGDPESRRYFKGTGAHNTVRIDDQDQAVQETGFIWSHPFSAALKKREDRSDGFSFEAYHDGYERLPGRVRHSRTVIFFDDRHFVVKDSFRGKGHHKYELHFHLHPDSKIDSSGGWLKIERGGAVIFMKRIDGGDFEQSRGVENPLIGWYAPRYGVKVPCPVLHGSKSGKPDEVVFITAICTGTLVDDERISSLV